MTQSQIFTEAHKIAKTLEGNYSARMSYALKSVYSSLKTESVEPYVLETYKYAGKMASGFHTSLYDLSIDENGIVTVGYADVEYPDGYRHGKQNACTMTAQYGLVVHTTGSGRYSGFDTNAQNLLKAAKGFKGLTYNIKDFIKSEFDVRWNGSEKMWSVQA